MLVTDRMQALGGHAKSSRQPPLKERRRSKADDSAANDELIVENEAAAEIMLAEDAAQNATTALAIPEIAPQPSTADNGAAQPLAARENNDDTSAAKRAIMHEWENWSALHSDELDDPNVAEYFFRHLEAKKPGLLSFKTKNKLGIIHELLASRRL